MAFRFNRQDLGLLATIAEYRVLSIRHLSLALNRNVQALRRRLKILQAQGLITIAAGGFGKRRGRPEGLLSLRSAGVEALKEADLLDPELAPAAARAESIHCRDHQLLVNDLRTALVAMVRQLPSVACEFFSPISPFANTETYPLVLERMPAGRDGGEPVTFAPDGVFYLRHEQAGKTLLFFLEVDMGTEVLVTRARQRTTIRQKVLTYQAYFRGKYYKRYERLVGCELRGFRLLFLAQSVRRLASLCRLVQNMPPQAFIWLTDEQSLLSRGVGAPIWIPGGLGDQPRQSLLGSRMPSSLPNTHLI